MLSVLGITNEIPKNIMNSEIKASTAPAAADADSIQKQIGQTRYILCASPDYLAQKAVIKKPQDLVGLKYITHTMRQPNDLIKFAGGQEVRVNPSLQVNDAEIMTELALQGAGIIWVHDYMVKEHIEHKRLVELLPDLAAQPVPIFACYKQKLAVQPKVRVFLERLRV